jgi:Holliday junction resolvase
MANPNKAKGTRWESAVAKFLQSKGFPVWRMAQTGAFDEGDLGGLPQWAFECRDRQKIDLSKNVKDANDRALAKGALYGVTVIKKRNAPVERRYVAMDLETFAKILERIERKENE